MRHTRCIGRQNASQSTRTLAVASMCICASICSVEAMVVLDVEPRAGGGAPAV